MILPIPERRDFEVDHVLVVDDHPLFCEALTLTLREALGVARVDSARSLEAALARLEADRPDAILLDLNLPDVSGLEGLLRLRRIAPGIPVIVVSSMSDPRIITAVMAAGAAGFVPKESAREVFIAAFRAIWAGETFTPPGYQAPSRECGERPVGDVVALLAELTPQQSRILHLVCEGKLNKQIAHDLSIAETTVKAHVTAILRKLGAHSRTHAVRIASEARFTTILRPAELPE